jgi:hypothetical protein
VRSAECEVRKERNSFFEFYSALDTSHFALF